MNWKSLSDLSKFGILAGILSISFHLSLYFTEKTLLAKISLNVIILLVLVATMVAGAIMYRSTLGGFIDFRTAVLCGLWIYGLGSFIFLTYTFFLFKFLDPSVYTLINEHVAKTTEYLMIQMNDSEESINESLREIRSKRLTLMQHFFTFFKMNVLGILFALIIAIFVKRDPQTA